MVIDTGPKNTMDEDTLQSEERSVLKKHLTEPTLLEMFGYKLYAAASTFPWLLCRARKPLHSPTTGLRLVWLLSKPGPHSTKQESYKAV